LKVKDAFKGVLKAVKQAQSSNSMTVVDVSRYASMKAYQTLVSTNISTYTAVMPDLSGDSVIVISITPKYVCDSITPNFVINSK